MSASPFRMIRKASPIAWLPAAQAVTVAELGPAAPVLIETCPAASLIIAAGIKNGDIHSIGLAQNNDFIEDVPLGDSTNLNTVEFKYYGFYHRIRLKLEQYWGNSLKQKTEAIYKAGRRPPASTNYITSLSIILDAKGNIVKVNVSTTSGIKELDDAAIESFNRAGPFPNPPKGMMKNGEATIEWGFVVKG